MFRKLSFISLLCLLSVIDVLADDESFMIDKMSLEDMITTLETIGSSCEQKPTKDDIREILLNEENPSADTKIFRRCLFEMFEILKPDSNQMNEEKIGALVEMILPNQVEEVKELVKHCNKENSDIEDKFEVAHQHAMCLLHQAKEHGFEIPELEK